MLLPAGCVHHRIDGCPARCLQHRDNASLFAVTALGLCGWDFCCGRLAAASVSAFRGAALTVICWARRPCLLALLLLGRTDDNREGATKRKVLVRHPDMEQLILKETASQHDLPINCSLAGAAAYARAPRPSRRRDPNVQNVSR
jgi:hypothetical protein